MNEKTSVTLSTWFLCHIVRHEWMSLAAPSKTTRSPDCASIASPSGVNGAPPRHDNMYISGSHRQPSRSKTTTLGFACSATVPRVVRGCWNAPQACSAIAATAQRMPFRLCVVLVAAAMPFPSRFRSECWRTAALWSQRLIITRAHSHNVIRRNYFASTR